MTSSHKTRTLFEKIIVHTVVISLLVILVGKLLFGKPPTDILLFAYGITVTLVIAITFFIALVIYKDPYQKAVEAGTVSSNPLISCLVAVHNEEDNIGKCLQSFIDQDYPNKEIILVDDASTDKTLQVVAPYKKKYGIKVIALKKNLGKKGALAEAVLVSKGKILAFTDSDCVLAPDAISKIALIFDNDPKVGAVSGHCRALNGDENLLTKVQDSWYEGQFSVRKAFESVFGAVSCVSGPLAVFRREAIYNFIPAWVHDKFLGQEFKFATDRMLTGFVLGSKYIGPGLKKKYADSPFVKNVDYPVQNWKILYCKAATFGPLYRTPLKRLYASKYAGKKALSEIYFLPGPFTGANLCCRPFFITPTYYLYLPGRLLCFGI